MHIKNIEFESGHVTITPSEGAPYKVAIAADSIGGLVITNDGTKTTLLGTAGDYLRIGDAATTSHSLASEDDLMITGKLEVGGAFHPNAMTLGGTVTLNGQAFDAGSGYAQVNTTGSFVGGIKIQGSSTSHGGLLYFDHTETTPGLDNVIGGISFHGYDGAGTPVSQRWATVQARYTNVTDTTEEATMSWRMMTGGAVDNIAMTLSGAGALWADLSIDTLIYKVLGTQVVGARVVDAKIDDAINAGAWDATTAGVLEACRDALVTHGLISAS